MRRQRSIAVATWTMMLLAGCATSGHADAASDSVWKSTRRRIELMAQLGGFRPASNPGTLGKGTSPAAAALGIAYELGPHFALQVEISLFAAQYAAPSIPTPSSIQYDDRMWSRNFGIAVSGKGLRTLGRMEAFARGGVGLYRAGLTLQGSEFAFPIPAPTFLNDIRTAPSVLIAAGVQLPLGWDRRWALGLEAKQQWLSADLTTLGGGHARLGGQMAAMTVARRFG